MERLPASVFWPGDALGCKESDTTYWLSLSLSSDICFTQEHWVGCHGLLQGIFPTQGSNPGLPYCRWILYHLNHQGSPSVLEWVVYPSSSGSSWPRNWTGVSCITGGFFTSWAIMVVSQFLIVKESQAKVGRPSDVTAECHNVHNVQMLGDAALPPRFGGASAACGSRLYFAGCPPAPFLVLNPPWSHCNGSATTSILPLSL